MTLYYQIYNIKLTQRNYIDDNFTVDDIQNIFGFFLKYYKIFFILFIGIQNIF